MEDEMDIPFFGKTYLFSMTCSSCHYHKADVEAEEQKEPTKQEFTVADDKDLNVRVVRSSEGIVTFGKLGSMEPGENAEGFVTNIEGLLTRFKKVVEGLRLTPEEAEEASEEDVEASDKAREIIKKLTKVLVGHDKLTITIEDPSGNSAIISEKTKVTPLKPVKKAKK